MNIISCRRALIAIQKKERALSQRRERAKDKPRWDEKHAAKLHVVRRQQTKLTALLMATLAGAGQFDHASGEIVSESAEHND